MADGFDTLGDTTHIESAGIQRRHAEAHATAAKTFIMAELVTKADLQAAKAELENAPEVQALRLTVRLGAMTGAMLGAAVAVIGAFIKIVAL